MSEVPLADSTEEHTCRICQAEGTPDAPLFHPCKCRGSIKYIHQECLEQWLSHANKKVATCDICHQEYKFTTVFDENTPDRMPLSLILRKLVVTLWNKSKLWITLLGVLVFGVIQLPLFWALTSRTITWCLDGTLLHDDYLVYLVYGDDTYEGDPWSWTNCSVALGKTYLFAILTMIILVVIHAALFLEYDKVVKDSGFLKLVKRNVGDENSMLHQPQQQNAAAHHRMNEQDLNNLEQLLRVPLEQNLDIGVDGQDPHRARAEIQRNIENLERLRRELDFDQNPLVAVVVERMIQRQREMLRVQQDRAMHLADEEDEDEEDDPDFIPDELDASESEEEDDDLDDTAEFERFARFEGVDPAARDRQNRQPRPAELPIPIAPQPQPQPQQQPQPVNANILPPPEARPVVRPAPVAPAVDLPQAQAQQAMFDRDGFPIYTTIATVNVVTGTYLVVFYCLPSILGTIMFQTLYVLAELSAELAQVVMESIGLDQERLVNWYHVVRGFIPGVMETLENHAGGLMVSLNKLHLQNEPLTNRERLIPMFLFYSVLFVSMVIYLEVQKTRHSAQRPLRGMQRRNYEFFFALLSTFKVFLIFTLELVVFPVFCGMLLMFAAAPLLGTESKLVLF